MSNAQLLAKSYKDFPWNAVEMRLNLEKYYGSLFWNNYRFWRIDWAFDPPWLSSPRDCKVCGKNTLGSHCKPALKFLFKADRSEPHQISFHQYPSFHGCQKWPFWPPRRWFDVRLYGGWRLQQPSRIALLKTIWTMHMKRMPKLYWKIFKMTQINEGIHHFVYKFKISWRFCLFPDVCVVSM